METALWAIGLVSLAALVGAFGAIFLKKASDKLSMNFKSLITNKYLIIGGGFYGLSTIFFVPALKGGELSVLYPIVASVYVWVSLLSVKFLNEKMNKFKWTGILLIIIGITFIGVGS
jgi:uncharacterized membrane protein